MGKLADFILKTIIADPKTLTLNVVLFIFLFISWKSDHKRVDQIIEAKEKEIKRLAEDNRQYRELYLVECMKFPKNDLAKISAGKLTSPTKKEGKKQDKRKKER